MKKIIYLIILFTTKISNVIAYHGGGSQGGGATVPTYASPTETLIYLLLPFLVFTVTLQQVFQFVVEHKVVDSWQDPSEYITYTTGFAILVVGILAFTRVFHALPVISDIQYFAIIAISGGLAALINQRDRFDN